MTYECNIININNTLCNIKIDISICTPRTVTVKLLKSTEIQQCYDQKFSGMFFLTHLVQMHWPSVSLAEPARMWLKMKWSGNWLSSITRSFSCKWLQLLAGSSSSSPSESTRIHGLSLADSLPDTGGVWTTFSWYSNSSRCLQCKNLHRLNLFILQ